MLVVTDRLQRRLRRGLPVVLTSASATLALPFAAPLAHAQTTNPNGLANISSGRSSPALVDLDGDGDLDVLAGDYTGNFYYFRNTGTSTSPTFAAASTNPFGFADVGSRIKPAVADLDNDGDLDVLTGEKSGNFYYFQNTGTKTAPAFAAATTNPNGLADIGIEGAPTLADLDGDGDLDVLAGELGGSFYYFQNTGTKTAPAFAAATINPFGLTDIGNSSMPTLVDFDGDGDLDVLAGESLGNFFYFQNTGTKTAPAFAAATTNPNGLADVGDYSTPTVGNLDGGTGSEVLSGASNGNFYLFSNAVLPVELTAFTAAQDGASALLRWQTASETNNSGFEVHELVGSADMGAFRVLGFVAGAGTSAEARRYSFRTETLPVGVHRFRLKQVDLDGTATYSAAVEVHVGLATPEQVEVRGRAVRVSVAEAQAVRVVAYDATGRAVAVLFEGELGADAPREMALPSGLASGVYFVRASGRTVAQTVRVVLP